MLRQQAVIEGRGSSTFCQIPEPVYLHICRCRDENRNFSQVPEPRRRLGREIFPSPKTHIKGELRISLSPIPYAGATSYFPHISSYSFIFLTYSFIFPTYSFIFTTTRNSQMWRHQAGAVLANRETTPRSRPGNFGWYKYGSAKSNISTYFFIFLHIFHIFLHIFYIFLHIFHIFLHIFPIFLHISFIFPTSTNSRMWRDQGGGCTRESWNYPQIEFWLNKIITSFF